MKKVGIITMHRIKNYGSVLQAYALKKVIESLGCEVCFVDFHQSKEIPEEKKMTIKNCIKYLLAQLIHILRSNNKKLCYFANAVCCQHLNDIRFRDFFRMIGVEEKRNYNPPLDVLVIGSDEVFNIKQNCAAGYSLELLGENNNAKKCISFAASFGYTSYQDISASQIKYKIKKLFCDFVAYSVRDKNSLSIIKKITGVIPSYHLDPVFHYDFAKELPDIKHRNKYIVVYAYSNLEPQIRNLIKNFANKKKLDILCFSGFQGELGIFLDVDPFKMLSYIKNAEYVITSTFHGCVFSIKYKKQFASIVREYDKNAYSNEFKVTDLLSRFNLEERIFTGDSYSLERILEKDLDSEKIDAYIKNTTEDGINYLKKFIWDGYEE